MLQNLQIVASQVLTLFLLMSVGFALRKIRRLSDNTLTQLTFLLLYVVAPSLIITSFQLERTAETFAEIGITALAVAAYFSIGIALSMLCYRKRTPDTRVVLQIGMVYTNNGFMGFPLVLSALGRESVLYAAVFLVGFALVQWTHGIRMMDKQQNLSKIWAKVVLNPGVISFAVGFLLFALNISLPTPLYSALEHLGNVNSPLAMLLIGAQIADADILQLFRKRELYAVGAVKLVILPAIMLLVLLPFHLPPLLYCTVVILAGTPTAAVTAMFARQFGRDATTAARLVSLTTLLSIITLPILAALAQKLSGA